MTGEWADKPIHAYARRVDAGTAVYFRQTVMKNSNKWNWDVLTEFVDKKHADGSSEDADAQIGAAVAGDRYGLGISNLHYASSALKPIALARSADQPAYPLTQGTVASRLYPLARPVFAYINRVPEKPVDPNVTAFLRYILSAEGQADLKKSGDYLPLNDAILGAQAEKLTFAVTGK